MVEEYIDRHCYVCGTVKLYEGGEQGITMPHEQYRKDFPARYPTGEVCSKDCVDKLLTQSFSDPQDIEEGRKRILHRLEL